MDEFENVRREPDPLERARRATDLLSRYQQRTVELARLRKEAIQEAADTKGMTLSQVAAAVGISKGRVTQIRQTAPGPERALFGVGPILVLVPERPMEGRPVGVIAAEDQQTGDRAQELLEAMQFTVQRQTIRQGSTALPTGDTFAICGPKTAPAVGDVVAADPAYTFVPDSEGHWVITNTRTGEVHTSPMDHGDPGGDTAYITRRSTPDGILTVVAGIHAMGSLGALHYLENHAHDVYQRAGLNDFTLITRATFTDHQPTSSEQLCLTIHD